MSHPIFWAPPLVDLQAALQKFLLHDDPEASGVVRVVACHFQVLCTMKVSSPTVQCSPIARRVVRGQSLALAELGLLVLVSTLACGLRSLGSREAYSTLNPIES